MRYYFERTPEENMVFFIIMLVVQCSLMGLCLIWDKRAAAKQDRAYKRMNGIPMTHLESIDGCIQWRLYEKGELHIRQETLTLVRNKANLLVGSINYWLNNQSPKKHHEISDLFADLWEAYQITHQNDLSAKCFFEAALNQKIGYTRGVEEGSFCVSALMAYTAYFDILKEMTQRLDIPIIEREVPFYPKFDPWLMKGFMREAERIVAGAFEEEKDNDRKPTSDEAARKVDELFRLSDEAAPRYERFRIKVTSCCTVCKLLDDVCRKVQ